MSGAENTQTSDPMMHGAQIGARVPIGSSTLTLAAHYYDLSASQGRLCRRRRSSTASANGNTTIGTAPTIGLAFDYEVIDVLVAVQHARSAACRCSCGAKYAQNQDPDDLDTAWAAGVLFGRASNYAHLGSRARCTR